MHILQNLVRACCHLAGSHRGVACRAFCGKMDMHSASCVPREASAGVQASPSAVCSTSKPILARAVVVLSGCTECRVNVTSSSEVLCRMLRRMGPHFDNFSMPLPPPSRTFWATTLPRLPSSLILLLIRSVRPSMYDTNDASKGGPTRSGELALKWLGVQTCS